MMRNLLALVILSLLLPPRALAQERVQIFEGDRVRLTAPDCGLREQPATFVSLENDILSATAEGAEIRCPFEALTRLEVSLGKRVWYRDSIRGMKYGLLVGLAAGVAILTDADSGADSPVFDAMLATVGLGATGFLVGTGIGAMRDPEEWLEAPLQLRRPSLSPLGRGRVQLGFSVFTGK